MVDRPIFADPSTAFASHFGAATAAVARALLDVSLPEPAMVWVTAEDVAVSPTRFSRGIVAAVLAWAEHLAHPVWSAQVDEHLVTVTATGELHGVLCRITGSTYRRADDGLAVGPVPPGTTVAFVGTLAAIEAAR